MSNYALLHNYAFDQNATPSPQACELMGLCPPDRDDFLYNLGIYLAEGINYDYFRRSPGIIAIRDIIDYDAVNVDTSRFPLLKLYRQTDTYKTGDFDVSTTKAIIAYCLTCPQQDQLPGLLKYMSKAINALLDVYHYNHENCPSNVILGERTAEYRIMVSEVTNHIYPFLRFNFSFTEL